MTTGKIWLSLPSQKVLYILGKNLASLLPAFLRRLGLGSKKVLVVSDPTVLTLHGDSVLTTLQEVGRHPFLIEVREGEGSKNLREAERLYEKFCELKATRSTLLIALGGGVITDLAAFAASTFMRGLPLILIPTTLLAQADAAIGGKTGVNLPRGKNLIGTFYHPKLVLIDPEYLKTLSQRDFRNGLAEIVKMSILEGGKKFKELARLNAPSGQTIEPFLISAIRAKVAIVQSDPFETGERMLLNLGHTFAHAIESATNYEVYTHGEAVSIGLAGACRLAEKNLGFSRSQTAAIEKLLARFGLPIRYKGVTPDALLDRMSSDKKQGSSLRFVLPRQIGEVVIRENVPEEQVLDVLEKIKAD